MGLERVPLQSEHVATSRWLEWFDLQQHALTEEVRVQAPSLYKDPKSTNQSNRIVLTPQQENRLETFTVLARLTTAPWVSWHQLTALGVEQRATHNSVSVKDLILLLSYYTNKLKNNYMVLEYKKSYLSIACERNSAFLRHLNSLKNFRLIPNMMKICVQFYVFARNHCTVVQSMPLIALYTTQCTHALAEALTSIDPSLWADSDCQDET